MKDPGFLYSKSIMSIDDVAKRAGFNILGNITVTDGRKPLFPKPPAGGGLYFIEFQAGGYYVGETVSFGSDGKQTGRFANYCYPADDIWTELVIHEILVNKGGRIFVQVVDATRPVRRQMEKRHLCNFLAEGLFMWNAGPHRCAHAYRSWLLPVVEQHLAIAQARYAGKLLTPYREGRLLKVTNKLVKLRVAEATYPSTARVLTVMAIPTEKAACKVTHSVSRVAKVRTSIPRASLRPKDKIRDQVQEAFSDQPMRATFGRREIHDLIESKIRGVNLSSIIPSDYCYNITNQGIRWDSRIFEYRPDYPRSEKYVYLGPGYLYNGPVIWRPKERTEALKVGEWRNGVLTRFSNWP